MISKRLRHLVFLITIVLLVVNPLVYGSESSDERNNPEHDTGPISYPIKFFRNIISRADGHRCSMYPTCSAYSAQAFQKHGFVVGWIMTSDRLLRCGRDETHISENIVINGQTYAFDPLHHNDFWWSSP